MDFLISRKVYAIIKGQHKAVFTLPLSLPYLWRHATLKEDITTGGKWRKQHWICGSFPFCCLGYWFVSTVSCSPHWSLTMYPIATLNSCSSCLCLWAEITTSMSQYTEMHILSPVTIFEAGIPHPSLQRNTYHKVTMDISHSLSHQVD